LAFSRLVSGVRQISGDERTFIFPTTHWTTLLQPINQRTEQAQGALNKLFETYRQPIIEYIRTLARHPQHAEDIAQDFIARMLTREDLLSTDRGKGRFRAYLSTSIRRFVISHYAAADATKRKELNNAAPLDEMLVEPGHANDAEKEFTRRWWRATIDEAVRRLRAEWEAAGKGALFGDLEPLLWDRKDGLSIHDIAARHQLTANAVSLRKMRLQERFREILVAVIVETVGSPGEVQDEIRYLLQDP
jgi:RNA polymerase sigma-70 factor (ECF subfamily)